MVLSMMSEADAVDWGSDDDSLSSQIREKLTRSVFDHIQKEFLPRGVLDELITNEVVRRELAMDGTDYEKDLVDYIINNAKKLFVVTLLTGMSTERRANQPSELELAMLFFAYGKPQINDSSLPILFDHTKTQPPFYNSKKKCRKPWDVAKISSFIRDQWVVRAPVFSPDTPELELDPGDMFPVIYKRPGVESGAFGEVSRVTIHPDHHVNPIKNVGNATTAVSLATISACLADRQQFDGSLADVAVKVIKQVYGEIQDEKQLKELDEEWEREVKTHIALRDPPHPNIIEFIAAVKRGTDRYLLFRWAEGGTLRKFWKANKRPLLNVKLVRDVVHQIRGLASALDKLHNYRLGGESYRHGDLKPENVMCVPTRDPEGDQTHVPLLKISDMGLAKHHKVATQLRKNKTSMQYTTTRYEPPEVVVESGPGVFGRSRRYDIWSLGCLMLEMMIWLLYGNDNLESFNKRIVDEYNQQSHWFEVEKSPGGLRTARIHRHVHATMETLGSDPECQADTAIRALLDIIKTRLLVVDLRTATPIAATESPRSEAGSRWYSQELLLALDQVISRGESDTKYWYTGRSRAHITTISVPSSGPSNLAAQTAGPSHQAGPSIRNTADVSSELEIVFSLPVPTNEELKTRRVSQCLRDLSRGHINWGLSLGCTSSLI